jgi:uncharacterized metal-binding protein
MLENIDVKDLSLTKDDCENLRIIANIVSLIHKMQLKDVCCKDEVYEKFKTAVNGLSPHGFKVFCNCIKDQTLSFGIDFIEKEK